MSVWCVCKLINQSDPEAQCRFTRTQRFIVLTHAVLYSGCLVCWCHLYPSCPAVSLCQTTQLAADSHVVLSVVCMLICWSCGSSVMIFICLEKKLWKLLWWPKTKGEIILQWDKTRVFQHPWEQLRCILTSRGLGVSLWPTNSLLADNLRGTFSVSRDNTETKSDKE